jgi:hypothetical protein
MNRETIVEHIKARDRVIVWAASNSYYRYWMYRPETDRVDYVCLLSSVPDTIKEIAKKEGTKGGVWVRGLAGIAALFPVVFRDATNHLCRQCNGFHNSDEVAERMLLLAQLHEPKTEYLDQPLVTMTAAEEKDVHQTAQQHFEEDRNELRSSSRAIIVSWGTRASHHQSDR